MTLQGEHDNRRGYREKFHDVAEIKQDVVIIIKYFLSGTKYWPSEVNLFQDSFLHDKENQSKI